jgi:hypothetical protein
MKKNVCDFSYSPRAEKYFQRKIFSCKIIFLKIFSNEKHFTLKQTEPYCNK